MDSIKVRTSWGGTIAKLSDAEAGRLLKALLKWAATGEALELPGREGIALEIALATLRQDAQEAARKAEARAKAGRASGAARRNCAKNSAICTTATGTHVPFVQQNGTNATLVHFVEQNHSVFNKEKERKIPLAPFPHTPNPYTPKKREKEDARACARGDGSLSAEEGAALAEDLQAVYAAAEHAGFPGDAATAEKLTLMVGEHGADAVLAAIDAANDQGKASLAYLRGILRNRSAPQADDFIPALTFD